MKYFLYAFFVALSVAVYPKALLQNSELLHIFNILEVDFFNWYRMILVAGMTPFIFCTRLETPLIFYLIILLISSIASIYPETVLYGTPMHHEGLFALLGYLGIYQASKKWGTPKLRENIITTSVLITATVAGMQLYYGNFLNFPLFKNLLPEVQMHAVAWPLYANMGGPNNLGLLCALLMPHTLVRKNWFSFALFGIMLICSQTRGAWVSVLITTSLISRRALGITLLALAVVSVVKPSLTIDRVSNALENLHWPLQDGDLSGRAYMWKKAVPTLEQNILLGSGPSTFVHYVPQFHERGDKIGFSAHVIDRPHNLFINIWHSTGLLSLLVLGYWLMRKLRNCTDASLRYSVIGFLIAGVFTDSVLCVTPYLSLLIGGINEHNEARGHGQGEASA